MEDTRLMTVLEKVTGLFDSMIDAGRHDADASNDIIKLWMLEALMLNF